MVNVIFFFKFVEFQNCAPDAISIRSRAFVVLVTTPEARQVASVSIRDKTTHGKQLTVVTTVTTSNKRPMGLYALVDGTSCKFWEDVLVLRVCIMYPHLLSEGPDLIAVGKRY